jgi:hypothetical protein
LIGGWGLIFGQYNQPIVTYKYDNSIVIKRFFLILRNYHESNTIH